MFFANSWEGWSISEESPIGSPNMAKKSNEKKRGAVDKGDLEGAGFMFGMGRGKSFTWEPPKLPGRKDVLGDSHTFLSTHGNKPRKILWDGNHISKNELLRKGDLRKVIKRLTVI